MQNLEKVKQVLADRKNFLHDKFYVREIGIFGSYVFGTQDANSDLDILVEFYKPIGFFAFIDLENYLKDLLGVKVDLVSKKALKPTIGKYILNEVIMV
ncbi:MAG: nucleotidyltransferase family protein [Candidatus Omnitrophota bacterium]